MKARSRTLRGRWAAAFALMLTAIPNVVYSQEKTDQKPNILVIMGDDIGWFNPSCYNRGIMGFNLDEVMRKLSAPGPGQD